MKTPKELRNQFLIEIEKEIEARNKLISEMVGTLYPSILQDEIKKLRHMRTFLEFDCRF